MAAKISFFRVGCGDMTLVRFDSGRTLLIDCNIRAAADDSKDDTPDVASQLKERLPKDDLGRPYVDAMLLSHPDLDHCRGVRSHFHLGAVADYPKGSGKILVHEMWSSPIVFRRARKDHVLSEDADAWQREARRRVKRYRELGHCPTNERILIMGEDVDGKTDDISAILIKTDSTWRTINRSFDATFSARLLAPLKAEDDDEEEVITKNNSSVVLRLNLQTAGVADSCAFLAGGDAEVAVWEKLWGRHGDDAGAFFSFDLLLAPHHCSWHSLSWDSWSVYGDDAEVCEDARSALSQARAGAKVIASSKEIVDDESDPPCIRAKWEYEAIVKDVKGEFLCLADGGPQPLEFELVSGGLRILKEVVKGATVIGRQPIGHG